MTASRATRRQRSTAPDGPTTSARACSVRRHQVAAAIAAVPTAGTRPPSVRASSRSSHRPRGPNARTPAAERAGEQPLEPRLAAADLEDPQLAAECQADRLAADRELG